jgi:Ca-activated chloride channel family protein
MRKVLVALMAALVCAGSAPAQGLLLPTDRSIAPLALVGHQVSVAIEDQVAETRVVQTFRNPTDRALEATYIFPVPQGANVHKFTMWMNGKEVHGELVEADKARSIYTDIVRRTQDPGLLEYMGNNLLKLRVFPVPAHGDQKVSLSYTSVAANDGGLIEYVYPLRGDGKNATAVENVSIEVTLKSQHPLQSIYSPSHAITVTRADDRHATAHLKGTAASGARDFQLYYTSGGEDVGLTTLFQRPGKPDDGHFLLLISPRAELARSKQVPRDIVFVLDTSGSMQGKRIEQARAALNYCIGNLHTHDRFGLIHFATVVTRYRDQLLPASQANLHQAKKWVAGLEAAGSTNIDEALAAALALRPNDPGRSFTVVFFTDGQPTVGECDPDRIVKNAMARNTAETRIFTFGVGDDVNAVLLDQLAEKTRSVSTYVREHEDIEAKVSSLYSKISRPVLTDLKLTVDPSVKVTEIYPPHLPDLFHGSQLVVLGRYHGHGPARVTLTGRVGQETREFTYEAAFPVKTKHNDKAFVEALWARRKVGYLLDQVRVNGENKELVDEIVRLAKKHGITTPYTSYLVAPDVPASVVQGQGQSGTWHQAGTDLKMTAQWQNGLIMPNTPSSTPNGASAQYEDGGYYAAPEALFYSFAKPTASATPAATSGMASSGSVAGPSVVTGAPSASAGVDNRGLVKEQMILQGIASTDTAPVAPAAPAPSVPAPSASCAVPLPTAGREGVDLSLLVNDLRTQTQVAQATAREVAGRTCRNLNGVWVDEGFTAKTKTVKIKAQSDAYFRLLEKQQQLSEVFQLGNRVVWITPSGTALVIDPTEGQERLSDAEIEELFKS